jgi:predicted nucleic acid-binding protein
MKNYVLDTCAFIAFLKNEEGHIIVDEIFKDAIDGNCKIFLHRTTFLEVYYEFLRSSGKKIADELFTSVSTQPIILIYKMDNNFIKHAGFYKVNYKISFADCFVLALATIKKASIISSDHHEFDDIEKSASLQFKWIR